MASINVTSDGRSGLRLQTLLGSTSLPRVALFLTQPVKEVNMVTLLEVNYAPPRPLETDTRVSRGSFSSASPIRGPV